MEGGTTYHFVTGGIEAALERARDRAVRRRGGGEAVRLEHRRRRVDPVSGRTTPHVTHLVYRR
jgi:hypothetical protein